MEEWPDDHLDELFRKSAEEYDVPCNDSDWADMSRRLDEYDRQTWFDRVSRWGGVFALVLLLLIGLGWVTYDDKPAGNQQRQLSTILAPTLAVRTTRSGQPANDAPVPATSQSAETTRRNVPARQTSDDKGVPEETSTTDLAGQETTKKKANQPTIDPERRASRPTTEPLAGMESPRLAIRDHNRVALSIGPASQLATSPKKRTEKAAGQLVIRRSATQRNQSVTKPVALDVRSVTENAVTRLGAKERERLTGTSQPLPDPAPVDNVPGNRVGQSDLTVPSATAGQAQPTGADLVVDSPWLPALLPATSLSAVVQQVRLAAEPTTPEVTTIPRSIPRLSRLSILLFASPDLSSIGLKNFDRPGSNAGLAIQYQLTDRLSVNTGAMYSTKRYQSNASEYAWPDNWAKDVLPEGIMGDCKMIDIPLNVRYDWLLRRRGDGRAPARWFASAGLTSYFIKHEVYDYEFANPADPRIMYWGWDNQKAGMGGGSFGFSNLNISAGYERPITNRLSWQVEPFMKVPLKQVGYFKIRLLSTGAFVGLRYRF